MRIITISREFGSGGREFGKRLADTMGIAYYDREIITAIAKKSALDENFVETVLEKEIMTDYPITFSSTFSYIPTMSHNIFNLLTEQQEVVKELAARGDCVMVGRNADTLLEKHNPFKIFVYADIDAKIKRCMERAATNEKITDRELEKKIKHVDKVRASYHNTISNTSWGDKSGYHLCINTTGINIKTIVPIVADYVKCWFAK
jgi:cytidylate kinase